MITTYEEDENVIHYAIGDVHGYLVQLEHALAWCAEDAAAAGMKGIVHLLGDYVDRGPDARGVIELLMAGPEEGHMIWRPLRGNHDDIFARAWRDPLDRQAAGWWEHGGQQTLMSYGWDPLRDLLPDTLAEWVPESHIEFLEGLPLMATTPEVIFVHAGLRPGIAIEDQDPWDLMWIRGPFLNSACDFGRTVVHGHTPDTSNPVYHPDVRRVAMDSGCFMGGMLAAAAFNPGERVPRFMTFGPYERTPVESRGFAP